MFDSVFNLFTFTEHSGILHIKTGLAIHIENEVLVFSKL